MKKRETKQFLNEIGAPEGEGKLKNVKYGTWIYKNNRAVFNAVHHALLCYEIKNRL